MNTAKNLFNSTEITEIMKSKLNTIKKLNLEKGLMYLQNTQSELYSALPREETKTIMLKVDRKKNIPVAIESIKEDLVYSLNVGIDIVNMAYDINTYNNIIYVKRKY